MLNPDAGVRARDIISFSKSRRPSLALVVDRQSSHGEPSERVLSYLGQNPHDRPVLVLDTSIVELRFRNLSAALPDTEIYYAVKANPAPEVLARLVQAGSSFDVASRGEIELCLAAGTDPMRLSYGNTIKREKDIAFAHSVGVPLFAFDAEEEVRKIARAAPGADVYCRLLSTGEGADWPLSRKFGCTPAMAEKLLLLAAELGLRPRGVSFHVGSQQGDVESWDRSIAEAAELFAKLDAQGICMDLVNLGGGFPARYQFDMPDVQSYGDCIRKALRRHFGSRMIRTIAEPGRSLVADAGVIRTEVVLVAKKEEADEKRWVYLDIGKFSGLAETMEEAIRYRFRTPKDDGEMGPVVIAGPTCDSADVLYENTNYEMPLDLAAGDEVLILSAGAYTSTYSSVAFNGFAPLEVVCI